MNKFNLFQNDVPYKESVAETFTFTEDSFKDVADLLEAVLEAKKRLPCSFGYIYVEIV